MPLVPAIMFVDIRNPIIFFAAWGIVLFLWIILWFVVPCNPNLNCTATTPRGKDGTKALLVSFLMVYGILIVVAIAARIFICSSGEPKLDEYGGGVLTNIQSLFQMGKVPKKGSVGAAIEAAEARKQTLVALEHQYPAVAETLGGKHGIQAMEKQSLENSLNNLHASAQELHAKYSPALDHARSEFGSISANLAARKVSFH